MTDWLVKGYTIEFRKDAATADYGVISSAYAGGNNLTIIESNNWIHTGDSLSDASSNNVPLTITITKNAKEVMVLDSGTRSIYARTGSNLSIPTIANNAFGLGSYSNNTMIIGRREYKIFI